MTKITASVEDIVEAISSHPNTIKDVKMDGTKIRITTRALHEALSTLPKQDEREVLMKYQEWCSKLPTEAIYWNTETLLDRYLSTKTKPG